MSRPEAGLDHAVWRLRAAHSSPHIVALPNGVTRGSMTPGRHDHADLAAAVVDDFVDAGRLDARRAMMALDRRSENDLLYERPTRE